MYHYCSLVDLFKTRFQSLASLCYKNNSYSSERKYIVTYAYFGQNLFLEPLPNYLVALLYSHNVQRNLNDCRPQYRRQTDAKNIVVTNLSPLLFIAARKCFLLFCVLHFASLHLYLARCSMKPQHKVSEERQLPIACRRTILCEKVFLSTVVLQKSDNRDAYHISPTKQ